MLNQLYKAAANSRAIIFIIEVLGQQYIRHEDNVDITDTMLADAKRRLSLNESLIARHA